MPENTHDVLTNYLFSFEVDGVEIARFKEVGGIGTEVAVIEHKENNKTGIPVLTKEPGWTKWQDITCKRGVTGDKSWFAWIKQVQDGDIEKARRNMSVVIYDAHRKEKMRFNFTNAWPSKVSFAQLQAGGNDIAIEDATFVHEGMTIA